MSDLLAEVSRITATGDTGGRAGCGGVDSRWEVHIKPMDDGRLVLKYLVPYVHRVAISDNCFAACDENSVTYSYTPSMSKTVKTRLVTGTEFV